MPLSHSFRVSFIIPYTIFTFSLVIFQAMIMRILYQSYKFVVTGELIVSGAQDMGAYFKEIFFKLKHTILSFFFPMSWGFLLFISGGFMSVFDNNAGL